MRKTEHHTICCQDLVEKVRSYSPEGDLKSIEEAFLFAKKAHDTQTRASGDPYISHPLEVAMILANMKLDIASIVTALLHDTVEDTLVTLRTIRVTFGKEVATLVDGVTKLSKIEVQSSKTKQAENFRKLVLAMSADLRVLLIKLADRLHNMRTLCHVTSPEKRKLKARETMDIYAPLAERIGMQEIRDELEDLAFQELNQDARDSIMGRLNYLKRQENNVIERVSQGLKDMLAKEGLDAEIIGREKRPYSIWRKMQQKKVPFEQLSDIIAFRVIVNSIPECYQALGVIHNAYLVLPNKFKDYISTPKPNGYQSLHTSVIGPERLRLEVQIRTKLMHLVAELGVAAHWQYKERVESSTDGKQYRWLRSLLDIIEQASGPEEFLEHTKLEMFQDQVFCFTPKGDLISLPQGATPVDFAYAVHSEVGDYCSGARVNGRMVPLKTVLRNGDQVEVLTSPNHQPSPAWERIVVTGKARARIRRFVRSQQKSQYYELGKSIIQKAFKQVGKKFDEKEIEHVLPKLKFQSLKEFYISIGAGHYTGFNILQKIYPDITETAIKEKKKGPRLRKGRSRSRNQIAVCGLIPGMAIHYAGCCHPLPGDHIVGIVASGRGVTIHTSDCEQLARFEQEPERWIDVSWDEELENLRQFTGRISVTVANKPGTLGTISTIIGKQEANILNLRVTTRTIDFFEILLDVEVKDLDHLQETIGALRTSSIVSEVERV